MKRKLYFSMLTITALILTILCIWQVKRYYYKKDLISKYTSNSVEPIILNCNELDWKNIENYYFRKVNFKLTPISNKKIYKNIFDQKTKKYSMEHYYIFQCQDKFILANNKIAQGEITPLARKNYFYPANQSHKGLWYNFDQTSLNDYLSIKIENFYLNNKEPKRNIENIHLSYAITWAALAIFNIYMIKKHKIFDDKSQRVKIKLTKLY